MKEHLIRNIIIFALVFLIIPVAVIIYKSNDRGLVSAPTKKEDTVIPMQRSNLDHSIINQEFLDAVNKAWREKTRRRIPLVEFLENFNRKGQIGAEYLGTYNGYIMFTDNTRSTAQIDSAIVANHNFISEGVYGFKDGVLLSANELYSSGELSYSDISEMHGHLCEAYYYARFYKELKDVTVSVPDIQRLVFDSETEMLAKQAVVTEFLLKELDTATVDDVVITDYYGLFDDVVFFIYKSPLKYYVNALKYEEVGEEVFVYQNGNRIYGFDGNRLYTLTEAFDAGLIEGADIAILKEYHTAYYPFAVDLYGSNLIGESIDKIN